MEPGHQERHENSVWTKKIIKLHSPQRGDVTLEIKYAQGETYGVPRRYFIDEITPDGVKSAKPEVERSVRDLHKEHDLNAYLLIKYGEYMIISVETE